MSAVLESVVQENLFSVLASNQTFEDKSFEEVNAESSEVIAPVVIEDVKQQHTAAKLFEAYDAAIKGVYEVNLAIVQYRNLCDGINHQHDVSYVDEHAFWKMHKSAIRHTVKVFKDLCMTPEAHIDAMDEFEAIVGEYKYQIATNFNDARKELSIEQLKDFRVDLVALWDGLAAKYADGGVRLARSQAATDIFKKFNLERNPFKIENGKAQLVTYVYCERKFNSKEHEYSLSSRRSVEELRKPLSVFLEFAEMEDFVDIAINEAIGSSWATPVQSGLKCIASPGHIEFKTFLREWKWTLSEHAAIKLREFIAEYANIGN